jgi:hypothetical protein
LGAFGFKALSICFGCPKSLALRDEEVTRITGFHIDEIAHLTQFFDTLKKNDLHFDVSLILAMLMLSHKASEPESVIA